MSVNAEIKQSKLIRKIIRLSKTINWELEDIDYFDDGKIEYITFKHELGCVRVFENYLWLSGENVIDLEEVNVIKETKDTIVEYNKLESFINKYNEEFGEVKNEIK